MFSPLPRFDSPPATVVEARDGTLIGARIADDGQWRFPVSTQIPAKFEKALLTFEDRYFYSHPGINPVSLLRALRTNLGAGEVISGGSTVTMQVARLARGNRERTYPGKFIEILSALKLELVRSKKAILRMYVNNAPFGGNIVGLEAASWRYTGKSPADLTWSEAAALSVLPNSPALVFPGRNQELLKAKRDKLLTRLYQRGILDSMTLVLSLDEPLPGEPKSLPSGARHLTSYYFMKNRGERVRTTIDAGLQERALEIMKMHQKDLAANFIFNSACIIVKVSSGEVVAYVGNSVTEDSSDHGGDVDIIRSSRSTGSILKPFLYAAMQQSGDLLPNTLVADIPTRFPGFSPQNFDRSYSGAVTAFSALSQSLNIPSVKMLQKYSPERFLELLHKTGFKSFDKPAAHYGLSLILGGGETSLWELAGVYASMSRVLKRYNNENRYCLGDYHPPVLVNDKNIPAELPADNEPPLTASAIWLTYQALQKVNRPENQSGWQYFDSSPDLAWKTGTSFGFRDAWAVGTTPDYVVAVWAGNADGEGRPGLTGLSAAAPAMFDLVSLLDSGPWFSQPSGEMTTIRVCSKSGFRAGPDCTETEEITVHTNGIRSEACPYHKIIHLNPGRTLRVNADCFPSADIISESWFVLPPAIEYFYKQKHPGYRNLPSYAPGCSGDKSIPAMEFIYPSSGTRVFIPRDQTGMKTKIIPEVAHRNPSKTIYWHLDDEYKGATRFIHQIEIYAGPGDHYLTAVDEDGNTIRCSFVIAGDLK